MMRITHSTGCDDLDPVILSSHLDQLAIPLTEIFNSSFATGIVPQPLNMAQVTPIFKQGSRALATNYCPISVLSYFVKIMEKIMYDRGITILCRTTSYIHFGMGSSRVIQQRWH